MVSVGVATAMSTTFDDNIYLSMFFSRTNRLFRPIHIVVGEILGFTFLIAVSLSGYLVGRMVDSSWLGLLGLMPISIGVNALLAKQTLAPEDLPTLSMGTDGRQGKRLPIDGLVGRPRRMTLRRVLKDPRTYKVSAVTIANGGNNIAIYIPLFANSSFPKLITILLICYAFICLWCLNSWFLIRQPHTAVLMSRVVSRLVPFALIALGLSIIIRSGTAQVLAALATTQ